MDCLNKVLEKLKSDRIGFSVTDYSITWTKETDEEFFIELENFDCADDKVAWFQSSSSDSHLLRVFDEWGRFDWVPKTYNVVFGCDCHLLEWYHGYLIFVYQEKHDVYLCSYKNQEVKTFNFHGDRISRKGNIFLFESYGPDAPSIRRIKIPELTEIEPISREAAEQEGLLPQTLDIIAGMVWRRK